jgi:hypothetical protein
MTHPGAPQQFPPHARHPQFAPQGPPYGPPPQQGPGPGYPHQYPPHGVPGGPPPRRGGKGPLIAVLVIVLVLGLAAGGYWVLFELDDSADARPVVDTSRDLEKAPIGCAMFEEAEVAPYIPGRMTYEAGSANSGSGELADQGQCDWNNTGTFTKDKVRAAYVIVTSYVYHATREVSGVDKAKQHMERRVRTGVAVSVEDADDAKLVAQAKVDWSAEVVVRYRNVVYSVVYSNQTDGANVKGGATALAKAAIGKVVPDGG